MADNGGISIFKAVNSLTCKVCGNNQSAAFKRVYTFSGFEVWACARCQFHFVPSSFTQHISYDHFKSKTELETVRRGNNWLKIQRHKERLRRIKPLEATGSLFDLGAGWGHFLAAAREMGYRVSGVELSEFQYLHAREDLQLPVQHANFFDCKLAPESIDIVTMWDVLEHIEDTDKLLDKVNEVLRTDGLLVIQVPQIDSFMSRKTKEKWSMLSDTHVNYFSLNTLRQLLQKHGFEVVKSHSSIELKLLLMYVIYPFRQKRKGNTATISSNDRQQYFNQVTQKPKWLLKMAVWLHDFLVSILSWVGVGEELVVYARKVK